MLAVVLTVCPVSSNSHACGGMRLRDTSAVVLHAIAELIERGSPSRVPPPLPPGPEPRDYENYERYVDDRSAWR